MKNKFKQSLYDSCKDVVNPATGDPAIKMMCGYWGKDCTPERWLSFMGDANMLSPFQIDYKFYDEQAIDGMFPHSNNPINCDKPAPVSSHYFLE